MERISVRMMFVAMLLMSCGGSLGGNPERQIRRQEDSSAGLALALSAASVEYAKSVYLTIDSVEVSTQGQNWTKLDFPGGKELDLLNLGDQNKVTLGQISQLKPDQYQKLRITFAALKTGRVIELSGTEYAIKLSPQVTNVIDLTTSISLSSQKISNFVLSVDLQRSLKKDSSNYLFTPKVTVGEVAQTGTLTGVGSPSYILCVYREGQTLDSDESCPNAEASWGGPASKFFIHALPEGNYTVRIFQNKSKVKDYQNVVIKAGVITDLGDIVVKKNDSNDDGSQEDE